MQGGVLLGPTFLGRNTALMQTFFPLKQASFLATLSKIGAAYFVFIYALKLDITTSLKAAKRSWRFGVIPFFSSYIVTAILLSLYKPHGEKIDEITGSVYSIPNVFTTTAFAVVSEALTELNLISTELGQIALSSAMITELMQWVTITLRFNSKDSFVLSLGFLTCSVLFVLSFFIIVRPMAKFIIRRTPVGKSVNEMYIVMILLGVMVMCALSDALGLYFIIGPILFGLVMPNGRPLATTIIDKIELINKEFLMPFFFLYIGLHTNFGEIKKNWKLAVTFQSILFAGFITKILACVFISPTYNMKRKHGLVLGLILSIKGIIELIFFARLRELKVLIVFFFVFHFHLLYSL
jgi:Kef-type K+ transport system membrane component KefB